MSRIFDALQRSNAEMNVAAGPSNLESELPAGLAQLMPKHPNLDGVSTFELSPPPEARLIASTEPQSLGSEKLRVLAARLRFAQQRKQLVRVLVTSSVRGDGKSFLSSNLAITFARQGAKTLLIDGDLYQSKLPWMLGAKASRGLCNWWREGGHPAAYLQKVESLPLWLLPAGVTEEEPQTILQTKQMSQMMQQLEESFTWIIIDSPPLIPVADASIWGSMSDAHILVVREQFTPRRLLDKAMESLDKSKIFALVMNETTAKVEERHYRGYYK